MYFPRKDSNSNSFFVEVLVSDSYQRKTNDIKKRNNFGVILDDFDNRSGEMNSELIDGYHRY